jgi:hypothetical protein
MTQNLVKAFEKAGLTLKILDNPLASGRNAEAVFGMDIQRKIKAKARTEFFRIYPGAARILVQGVDKATARLVLLVDEPETTFEDTVPGYLADRFPKEDILRKLGSRLIVQRRTPAHKRHFLMGVDERQLFVAQCPHPVTTVREADESLKSGPVILAEGKVNITRQGEWFFLETTRVEREFLDERSRKGLTLKKVDIESRRATTPKRQVGTGNPHVVDEFTEMGGTELSHGFPVRTAERYIRGKVRHVDHKTVTFKHWRRVIRNAEGNNGRMAGVAWID